MKISQFMYKKPVFLQLSQKEDYLKFINKGDLVVENTSDVISV